MKKSFPSILKALRGARNMKEFADYIGVPVKTYEHYEYGTRKPNIQFILQLVEGLDVSADYLLGLSDEPHASKSVGSVSVTGHSNAVVNGDVRSPVTLGGHCEGCDGLVNLKARVGAIERRMNAETPQYVTEH